jgi:hypothetical protein
MRIQNFLSERENQPLSGISSGSEHTVLQRDKKTYDKKTIKLKPSGFLSRIAWQILTVPRLQHCCAKSNITKLFNTGRLSKCVHENENNLLFVVF